MKSFLFILTRFHYDYIDVLNHLSIDKYIVYDHPPDDKYYIDNGFYNLTQTVKQPSSWDKSFYYLCSNQLLNKYDYFYFLEDDVYTHNIKTIQSCISLLDTYHYDFISSSINTKENTPNWCWWRRYPNINDYFDIPCKSFNPFCKLSKTTIKKVLSFRETNRKFLFHEILFPSICMKYNLSMIDYTNLASEYFGVFRWRPTIPLSYITDDKIYHPVKDHIRLKESLDS